MTRYRLANQLITLIRRRPILSVLLALLMVVTVAIFWKPWEPDDASLAQNTQVQWLRVQPQLIEQQLGLMGRIQAARQETLSAPFEAVIREVLVQEGQTVEAGQTLLRLDPGQIEIQLRQAQAELLKAQREVHQLRNWDSSPEVSRARRAVQTARSILGVTQANLRDTRALFERGIVARMEVDTLAQQVRMQQQDLLSAQDELLTVEARGQGEERKIAEMELVNAQARHQAVAAQSERQVLKAPFSGVILRPSMPEGGKAVIAQAGVQVMQGAPLLLVIGLDRIQVLTRVEEADLHQLREGMPVQITGDGFAGQTLTGRIATIAVQGNAADAPGATAHYDIVISVDRPHAEAAQQVRLGMSARLAIIIYRNEQGIAVPPQALGTDDDGSTYVRYRATLDAAPSKIRVTPGRAIAQGIEVQGLQSGYVLVPAN
ncbi:efflux RND transporter periplasmic adaptor subunit [Brenneria uluponensis]|uniref:efflux RND transporter periplasmic adaptor subunit n=1 Tax=Brenneria uluponensis TaxID=3057057 RepID=UPI0028F14685|nr:HlyD family efflux transporter periplasmic adaptor subunit [Brenneria ulupoensis]